MLAFNIMLVALAQSSAGIAAPHVARPDVEVIGPTQHNRVICRTIGMSGSRIPSRQVCRTTAEIEEARDRAQREGGLDLVSTDQRTRDMLETSSYGNWMRAHFPGRISETSVGQTERGQ